MDYEFKKEIKDYVDQETHKLFETYKKQRVMESNPHVPENVRKEDLEILYLFKKIVTGR